VRRSSALALGVVLAILVVSSAGAAQPVATLTVQAKIAAYRGWVVWSAPGPRGFRLMASHGSAIVALPGRPRTLPFDVDLGTDEHGRTVATYSRCSGVVRTNDPGLPALTIETGCRVRVLDLENRVERVAGIPHRRDESDTFPSMWRGRIAFARRDVHHHGAVDQVLLWSPRARRVTVLPHGGVPTRSVRGRVQGLDLGPSVVSFLWSMQGPGVNGRAADELRVDRIATRDSVLIASGHGGEACTANPDAVELSAPTVDANRVWFSQLSSACNVYTSALFRYATSSAGETAPLPGIVLQVAKDGPMLFALVATPGSPACTAATPCTVEPIAPPPLAPVPG
jgi:hypothetical protein